MSESPGPNARTNRLARESSPYLLLHQHNPVDWYAWGAEAFERARREDKPIFLSVGYSTCYWCHVMERESFSDPDIAGLMNREFVSIKLDREERPDLDEIYMAATQLLTEHGGWPNSVFLTPKLEPFYAGTYFPPADRHGLPGFPSLLRALSQAWRDRRDEIEAQAEELVHAIGHHLGDRGAGGATPPDPATPGRALAALERRFDPLWGGFGGAPKFPTPSNLLLLFEFAEERPRAAEMLHATLDQMARGGLYDQLGGGFHRYATDREWRVPHFEKMLYDNGLLLALYAREYDRTADPEMARVARETAAFLERELSAPEGGFWSAIDAETGGHEGAFYVWSRDELLAALGPEDLAFLAPLYGFEGPPFFEGSRYVLHLPAPLEQAAERRRLTREELLAQMGPLRQRLFALRALRRRPLTDDKVLADWNGLAIAGLAEAGTALGDAALVERAARAARFVVEEMRGAEGVLLHAWRAGQGKVAAFLSDYAYLVQGLLVLHRASGERRWLEEAIALSDEQEERLADPLGGYFAAAASPDVLFRSKDLFDGATPAPNAVAVLNHLELWSRTGEERWLERAERSLRAFAPLVERQVDAARTMAVATRRWHELKGTVAEAAAERVAEPTSRPLSESEGAPTGPVSAELEIATSTAPGGDGWRPFRLNIAIADGWHIHANPSSHEYLMPTELDAEGAELRGVAYPPGRALRIREDGPPLAVYQGSLTLTGEVRPEAGSSAWLLLGYQPCDDRRCLAPMRLAIAIDR